MTSRSLRRVLAGTLVTAFLSVEGPVPGVAAGFSAAPAAPAVLVLAWQWLAAQIFLLEESAGSSDAGWVIDPDG